MIQIRRVFTGVGVGGGVALPPDPHFTPHILTWRRPWLVAVWRSGTVLLGMSTELLNVQPG